MLGAAWDANLDEIRQTGEVDLLCFTGDLASSGKDHEYGSMASPALFTVSEFMDRTIARLGLSLDKVYFVPGNHDIDRNISAVEWAELRKLSSAGTRDDADLMSQWMCGGNPPRGYRPELRPCVLARQAAYRRWVEQYFGTRLLPHVDVQPGQPAQGHPALGYRHSRMIGCYDVHVLGLDSAWLAGNDDDARKLWLTHDQVLRASTNHEGRTLAGLRIALVHHPLGELADGGPSEELLAGGIDLLLHGHLHEAAVRTIHDPQRTFRIAAAGSLYERDTYRNGMQVIDVTLDHDGRPRRYDVWFRSWSSRAKTWRNDDDVYATSQQGRVTWWVEPPAPRAELSKPPLLPVRVVYDYPGTIVETLRGRAEQLTQLMSSLMDPEVRCTVISGRAGSGKTALACNVLAELIQARAVHGVVMMSETTQTPFSVNGVLAGLNQLNAPPRRLSDAVLADNTRTFRSRLEQILNNLDEREVILLLDNFESLIRASGELDPDVAELLELNRSHRRHRLHIVITTRQIAIKVFDDPKLIRRVELTDQQGNDLDAGGAESLLRWFEQAHRLGLSSTPAEVFAKVHRLTRGNPRELERIVGRLIQSPGLTLAGWVSETTEHTGKLDEFQVEVMFTGASPLERAVLLAVAVSGDPASAAHIATMLTELLGGPGFELSEVFDTLCGRYQLRRCEGGYAMHSRDREVLLEVCQRTPIEVMGRELMTAALQRADCEILETRVVSLTELSSAAQAETVVRAITRRLAIGDLNHACETLLATEDQLLLFGEVAFVADTAASLLKQLIHSESERCRLYVRAGDAKSMLGEFQAALAYYDQARQIATVEQMTSIDVMRARFLIDLDRLAEAADVLRRLGNDSRVTTSALGSIYWHERARLACKQDRLDDALDYERIALRECEGDEEHGQRANVTRALMDVGRFLDAEPLIRKSIASSRGTLNRVFHATQLAILSDALLGLGKLAAAEEYSLAALEARREIGVAGYLVRSLLGHGWLMEVQDRVDEAAMAYREALEIQSALKDWPEAFPATEISVALATGDVDVAAAALSKCEATSPTSDRDHLLLGTLRLAQGEIPGATVPFHQVVQQARKALATCARNTRAGQRLVVALCGLVAAGENHDVVAEIDRFRSNIDSLGPVMELCYQLRMLHRYDRTGRTTPALERCNALISRPADLDGSRRSPDPAVLAARCLAKPMPSTFTFPPPLVEAYQRGTLAVLFGSGLSMASDVAGGFPRWSELPDRFLDQVARHGVWTPAQIGAKRAFFAGGYLSLESMLAELDALKTVLRNARRYRAALMAIFQPPRAAPGDVHRALVELGVHVLLTTNFDELLEHVEGWPSRKVYTWLKASQVIEDIQRSRKVLFKIHGTVEDDDSVVMSRAEYDKAAAHAPYQRAMSLLLQKYVFLLVGYGINDPLDLDLLFGLNATVFATAAPTHYALMKEPSATDRDRWQREMNIQVVPYDDHDKLPAILRALARTTGAPDPC